MITQQIRKPVDAWEPYIDIDMHGKLTLSNIEFTTTNLCNMRCAHCAVGYTLQTKEDEAIDTGFIMKKLDEAPDLRVMSFTGGEPLLTKRGIRTNLLPLLKYAKARGIKTQINSNLTLPKEHFEMVAPYLDVMHISHNWGTVDEFVETGFAMMEKKPSIAQREKLFYNIIENSRDLAASGVLVSAETMLNRKTLPYLSHIHNEIVNDMHCKRHEIHPMYPSDFASDLDILSLDEIRTAVNTILDVKNEDIWMLFGTLPFYACSQNEADRELLARIHATPNTTIRNDVDGRSRLNINMFSGEMAVSDFSDDGSSLGNIKTDSLTNIYDTWLNSNLSKAINCHCPSVKCLGVSALIKSMYYKETNFVSGSVK